MSDLFGLDGRAAGSSQHQSQLPPAANKFHAGNGEDGKHYWLTPPSLYQSLDAEFSFDFDPCPFPLPEGFDGLTVEWGQSSYVNPPFGSIVHHGRKKGMTAWVRKALDEHRKGKRVVMVYPLDKWILMLLEAGAKVRNLFSGIGGFSLGLERTGGFETVAFCEIDQFCRRVLKKHWPEVPIYDDVRTLTVGRLRSDGIAVDAICGGFPCQDISWAGAGAGLSGAKSGLWSEYARIIGELRPRYVFVENVAALLSRGLGTVLGDLAAMRYDAEWFVLAASQFGAPHDRERLWLVAYSSEEPRIHQPNSWDTIRGWLSDDFDAWPASPWPSPAAAVCRVDDGISHRVDRSGALGNAVVPQIPELIGRAILEARFAA